LLMSAIVKELLSNFYNIDESSKFDLETAIKSLAKNGELTDEDILIIQLLIENTSIPEVTRILKIPRNTLVRKINEISDKIARFLGEEYQDDKLLFEVEKRLGRPLTEEEIKFCKMIIKRGRAIQGINIYNFKIKKDGRIIKGKDKKKRQVDV